MEQWKIRVITPEGGQHAVRAALAAVPAAEVQPALSGDDSAGLVDEVVVSLREDRSLPDLLHALHDISPQVFVSRVPAAAEAGPADTGPGQIRVRKLSDVRKLASGTR